jgi:hypothetical protein
MEVRTMNRHERRVAEARMRQRRRAESSGLDAGFEAYRDKVREVYTTVTEREIGESWMRGEAWAASEADAMIIHRRGETRRHGDDDLTISAKYGSISFTAYVEPNMIGEMVNDWDLIIHDMLDGKQRRDPREGTRATILLFLLEHRYTDGDAAAFLTYAIVWLAATSLAGSAITTPDSPVRRLHYEISDITGPQGQRGQNFRLILSQTDDLEFAVPIPTPGENAL